MISDDLVFNTHTSTQYLPNIPRAGDKLNRSQMIVHAELIIEKPEYLTKVS